MTAKPQRTWPQILTIFPGIRFAVPKLNPGRLWKPDNKYLGLKSGGIGGNILQLWPFFPYPRTPETLQKGGLESFDQKFQPSHNGYYPSMILCSRFY